MFLSKEFKRHEINTQITSQTDPKPGLRDTVDGIDTEVGEDGAGAVSIGTDGLGDDGCGGADDLCGDQGEGDVETGQSGEEDHAETDALEGVEDAEPEPETAAGEDRGDGAAGPRQVVAESGGAPEHLCPARGAEADGE